MPYWLDQLRAAKAGTPNGDYVERTIRELLARYGAHELNALAASWRIAHGGAPRDRTELVENLVFIDPLRRTMEDLVPTTMQELLDPRLVRHRYPRNLPAFGPLIVADGRLTLRTDPYGRPWYLKEGQVLSPGQDQASYEKVLGKVTLSLLTLAQKQGHWPATLDEAKAMGLSLPDPPEGGTVRLDGRQLVVDWVVEAGPPWPLRQVPK